MIHLLEKRKDLIKNNFQYFFFDEFQDISEIEYYFLKLLFKNGIKLILIGDDA